MIFEILSPKKMTKKIGFFEQIAAVFEKNRIITLFFKKSAIFFAEN
jgi:hypothetical protein